MTNIKMMTTDEELPGYKGIAIGTSRSNDDKLALKNAFEELKRSAENLGADEIRDIRVSTAGSEDKWGDMALHVTLIGTAVNTEEALADDGRTMDMFK